MKVGILSASVSHNAGGIYEVTRRSTQELHRRYVPAVEVFGLEDERSLDDLPSWGDIKVHLYRVFGPKSFCYSPDLYSGVRDAALDLLHVHGIWTYTSIAGRRWSAATRRPSLVSTHGMLDAWPLRNRRWKKQLAGLLYERSHLSNATCLHALSVKERDSIRAYGLTNPVAVIPTGIDVPDLNPAGRTASATRTLLYLGRLHEVKGLVHLIRGWHEQLIRRGNLGGDWRLAIAGWDDGGHGQGLKALCRELELDDTVQFVGPKYGQEKQKLLSESHAFVLPSLSEGLPISVLEAWAYGLPVLMTPECNLPRGFTVGAALPIDRTAAGVADGLHSLFSMKEEELSAMGAVGRQLVQKEFSWATVTSQLYSVYAWLVNGGDKPECVELAQ